MCPLFSAPTTSIQICFSVPSVGCSVSKHFWHCPQNTLQLFSEEQLPSQEKEKKKTSGGRNSGCWVLYISHGSVSRDSISQGGRRFFGVFLNQANKGFPLHDHQTFFSEINRNEWKSYIPLSIQNKKHCEILKVYKVKSFWNSPSRSQKV